jgi:hypothetical protein
MRHSFVLIANFDIQLSQLSNHSTILNNVILKILQIFGRNHSKIDEFSLNSNIDIVRFIRVINEQSGFPDIVFSIT